MKVQPTLSVSFDDKTVDVSSLSENTQHMIALLDEWRQKESDITNDLVMVRSAMRDLQNNLLAAVQKDTAPKDEEAAVAEAPAGE